MDLSCQDRRHGARPWKPVAAGESAASAPLLSPMSSGTTHRIHHADHHGCWRIGSAAPHTATPPPHEVNSRIENTMALVMRLSA